MDFLLGDVSWETTYGLPGEGLPPRVQADITLGWPTWAQTAYRDTIGDLMASLSGSFIGGALVATVLWEIGRPRPVAERCPDTPSALAS